MNTLHIFDDHVFHFKAGHGTYVDAQTFLEPIKRTGSLRVLRETFPARRGKLLEALEKFGFEFDKLLQVDFKLNQSDVHIATKHGVDPKWIRQQRDRLDAPSYMGRPSNHPSDAELERVFEETGRNHTEAARRLGMDRGTFTKRYREMRDRVMG